MVGLTNHFDLGKLGKRLPNEKSRDKERMTDSRARNVDEKLTFTLVRTVPNFNSSRSRKGVLSLCWRHLCSH